jgi:hypothetical protein
MHSMDIFYNGIDASGGHELFSVLHNGDFEGDITINMEGRHRIMPGCISSMRHDQPTYDVCIPFEVLAEIVAAAVQRVAIAELEDADYKDILGL